LIIFIKSKSDINSYQKFLETITLKPVCKLSWKMGIVNMDCVLLYGTSALDIGAPVRAED